MEYVTIYGGTLLTELPLTCFCVINAGYFILHFVQFLFAVLFVYGVVIPLQEGRFVEWLTNFGFVL